MKLRNILYGLASLPLLHGCDENLGGVSIDGNVVHSESVAEAVPAKPQKDLGYLEGIVIEECANSGTLPDNHYDYALKVETNLGAYTFAVYGNNPKPINALAAAIEKGDKIRFSLLHDAYFDKDRIGYCDSNHITLLEKGKSNYSDPAEQEKN